MSEVVLLGAGASIEAGVPGANAMTEEIVRRFNDNGHSRQLRDYAAVLNFVVGGLLFNAGQRGVNPFANGVNVEDLFNAVNLLAERNTLEVLPFVGSWHSMIDEFDRVTPSPPRLDGLLKLIQQSVAKQMQNALNQNLSTFSTDKIDKAAESNLKKRIEAALKNRSPSMSSSDSIGRAVADYVKEISKKWSDNLKPSSSGSNSDLDKEFKEAVQQLRERPGGGRKFKRTAEKMILMLKDLVWIEDAKKINHLRPLSNLSKSQKRLVVATLNYDNAVELMCETNGISCNTGIDFWSKKGVFDFAGDGLHLVKLHGSIDWTWEQNAATPERPMPHSVIRRVESESFKKSYERPAVVFGQRNKLTAEGPFLDLLRQFQNELEDSELLTVIGYSFRDPHINTYISKWLNESATNKIRIVDPYFEISDVEYVRQLKRLRNTRYHQIEVMTEPTGVALLNIYSSAS